jgi:hypothetical protein
MLQFKQGSKISIRDLAYDTHGRLLIVLGVLSDPFYGTNRIGALTSLALPTVAALTRPSTVMAWPKPTRACSVSSASCPTARWSATLSDRTSKPMSSTKASPA